MTTINATTATFADVIGNLDPNFVLIETQSDSITILNPINGYRYIFAANGQFIDSAVLFPAWDRHYITGSVEAFLSVVTWNTWVTFDEEAEEV